MSTIKKSISVVIPVFKNRDSIELLYSELVTLFKNETMDYQIIFVDDDCPEKSIDVLNILAYQDKSLIILKNSTNIGQQKSVIRGLKEVRNDLVVIMDADLQDSPKTIPLLMACLTEDIDVVFAGRTGHYQSKDRMLSSKIFKRSIAFLTGLPPDAGIFLVMKKSVCIKLSEMNVRKPFIVAMIGSLNIKSLSIPIRRDNRAHGSSAYSSFKRLKIGVSALIWVLGNKIKNII